MVSLGRSPSEHCPQTVTDLIVWHWQACDNCPTVYNPAQVNSVPGSSFGDKYVLGFRCGGFITALAAMTRDCCCPYRRCLCAGVVRHRPLSLHG